MYPVPKRILDLVVAVVLVVLLSPLLLAIVVLLVVDAAVVARDRGPLFYREMRVSRGRPFRLLKFRTLRREVLRAAGGHARPHEADLANLTLGGRVIKRWYLDELPQLFNVVRGDMSFVGPRPWPPELVAAQVADGLDYRNRVVAGLTGPAQVTKGTAGTRYAPRDLDYVRALDQRGGWGIVAYDLRLMAETVGVLARGKGLSD